MSTAADFDAMNDDDTMIVIDALRDERERARAWGDKVFRGAMVLTVILLTSVIANVIQAVAK